MGTCSREQSGSQKSAGTTRATSRPSTGRSSAPFVNSRRLSPPPRAPGLMVALQRNLPPVPSAGPVPPRPPRLSRGSRPVRKFLFAQSLRVARPPSGTNFLRPQTFTRPSGLPTKLPKAQQRAGGAARSPPPPRPCSHANSLHPLLGAQNLKPTLRTSSKRRWREVELES